MTIDAVNGLARRQLRAHPPISGSDSLLRLEFVEELFAALIVGASPGRYLGVHLQEVGLIGAARALVEHGDPAAIFVAALVGERRVIVAIRDDDFARGEGGLD